MALQPYTLPPATRADGTGNPPADMDAVINALLAAGAGFNVMAFGADPTGVTDCTAAFQNAVNAAQLQGPLGGPPVSGVPAVVVPPGSYQVNGLSVSGAIRLTGCGPASRIFSTSGDIVNFANSFITHLEIDHLTLDATGGWIFDNLNVHRSSFHHLVLIARSGSFGFGTISAGGGISTTDFDTIVQYVFPDPVSNVRSVPGWQLLDNTGGGKNVDGLTFKRVTTLSQANANGAIDNTQYIFDIACQVAGAGGLADAITFISPDFGACLGGGIRLRSVQGAVIQQPKFGNMFNQGTPSHSLGNSMIFIGQYPGAAAAQSPVITGFVIENSGTLTLGTFSHIECDAATANLTVIGPDSTGAATNPAVKINLNGAAGAVVIGGQANVNVANQAADTTVIGNGTPRIGGLALGWGQLFGSGADGAVTLDGTVAPSWASKAGSVYTLTRDVQLTSLTVNSGVTLRTANFRVFCQGTLSGAGTIDNSGSLASGSSAGTNAASGSLTAGRAGGAGGTGVSGPGGAGGNSAAGTAGGAGGTGTSGAAGAGGSPANATAAQAVSSILVTPYPMLSGVTVFGGTAAVSASNWGSGGGGGGSDSSSNAGGGGGAGGGVVAIFAYAVTFTGTISATGGNGGTAAAGNAGGGGGGGGGLIFTVTLAAPSVTITNINGGASGSGHGTGTSGSPGGTGSIVSLVVE